jgi:ssDNA-binding Zn-finger/Zn-ribbon topoisomerase 1
MPCPDCGSTHLIQHNEQSENVFVSEGGDPEYYEPRNVKSTELWCPKCDEKLWQSDN